MGDTGDEGQGGSEAGGQPGGDQGGGWWSLVADSEPDDTTPPSDAAEQPGRSGSDWLALAAARGQSDGAPRAEPQPGAGQPEPSSPGFQPSDPSAPGQEPPTQEQPQPAAAVTEADVPGEEGNPPPTRRRRRMPRRPTVVAAGFLVVAVVALVASIRYAFGRQEVFDPSALAPTSSSALISSGNEAEPSVVDLPDVIGLETDRATAVLQEAGLDSVALGVVEIEWAAPAGVVVQQNPAPGTNDPESVTLSVSVPAPMPELTGVAEDDATEALRSIGVSVEVEYKYQANATVGAVLSQSVAAGTDVPETVDLVVAGQGASVKLGQLELVGGDCGYQSEERVNGQVLPNSVSCSLSTNVADSGSATYLLSREFEQFVATIGVADTSVAGFPVSFRVLVDDVPVYSGTLSLGASEVVSVPVSGALRLTLEVSTAGGSDSYESVDGVFGDPSLRTSPEIALRYEEP